MRKVAHAEVISHLVDCYLMNCRYFKDDCWYEVDIPLDELYNTHTDFQGCPTPPDATYRYVYESVIAPLMLLGELDFLPVDLLPESRIFCFKSDDGKYYVIDGSLRTFNAIQHGQTTIGAYLYLGGDTND